MPLMRRWHVVHNARQDAVAGGRGVPLLRPRTGAGSSASPGRPGRCCGPAVQRYCAPMTPVGSSKRRGQPMNDELEIRQLIERWAVWRDAGDWERFATVWHPDGVMMATWFQGPFAEFIRVTKEGWAKGVSILHFLGGSAIEVAGERAIAQTKMTISQRGPVERRVVRRGVHRPLLRFRGAPPRAVEAAAPPADLREGPHRPGRSGRQLSSTRRRWRGCPKAIGTWPTSSSASATR